MWTSIWSSKVRNARHISTKINHPPNVGRFPPHFGVHLLRTSSNLSRRVPENRLRRRHLRLWPDPSNLCLRRQLPDPEIPPSSKHSDSKCIHISSDTSRTPLAELGGRVQDWAWASGRVAGAQPVVVDHCGGAVCIHLEKREVQAHVERFYVASVHRVVWILQIIGGVCSDALFRDVVFSDSGSAGWLAGKS